MAEPFSAESRLIHAGTERVPGQPATPPLAPASIYVSAGTRARDGATAGTATPAAVRITDIDQALEVL